MPPLEMRTDSPGRLQKYPKNHVSTGELFSGSSTDSTQGPLENFNKLPTRQGNRKNINLSELLKSVNGATGECPNYILSYILSW